MITLVLGGVRSGKSRFAEHWVQQQECAHKIYMATSEPCDDEMRQRIAHHQQQRSTAHWHTIEEPLEIAACIAQPPLPNAAILVDCLTLWLNNLMHYEYCVPKYSAHLLQALEQSPHPVTLVANEIGLGIMPTHALARQFADEAGFLHQKIAQIATHVVWMVAGIATFIKSR